MIGERAALPQYKLLALACDRLGIAHGLRHGADYVGAQAADVEMPEHEEFHHLSSSGEFD
jgi:hypothetical protein